MNYPPFYPGEEPPRPEKPRKSRAVMWKVLTIVGLILGLLIPLNMIAGIIYERQTTKHQVVEEISQTWAGAQTLMGPVLAVPYKIVSHEIINGKSKTSEIRQLAYLLPQTYNVTSKLKPEVRYRGIYQSVVYSTDLQAEGSFDAKTIEELNIPKENVLWDKAFITVGLPQTKGISNRPGFLWQGKPVELLPGVNGNALMAAGLYSPVAVKADQKTIPFKLNLAFKGSQFLSLIPIGKQNSLQITSPWQSPSFTGSTLPTDRRVTKDGFTAKWEIPYFARNYGQAFTNGMDAQAQMLQSAVGVELLTPVDSYRQSERAVKYGILFLVLTFATYFLFEIISRHRLHPFQYLLVGLAISLFYLLLIAVSEVTQFAVAYGAASLATIAAVTLYSRAILGRVRRFAEAIIGGLLTVLYGYLYILLQLEDLSLLFGAIGLFVVLAVIMYVTRNIDWYSSEPVT